MMGTLFGWVLALGLWFVVAPLFLLFLIIIYNLTKNK
jgi:hypothetical protein